MSEATILERLQVANFRNLRDQRLGFEPGIHLVGGANGQGKTNLLDAVHYLCLTRSHFSYGDAGAIRHGADFFRVAGRFRSGQRPEHVVVRHRSRKPKVVERNGVAYGSLAEHVGLLPAVMISPSDIELATGGPEERRRFMDQTISQYDPRYLRALMTYNRVLKLRNAHLKAAGHPLQIDLTLLAAYDRQLGPVAGEIHGAREAFATALTPHFESLYAAIGGAAEAPALRYASRLAERPFGELLMRSRDQDAILGRTNVGPHRDDLQLSLGGEPLRRYASQGQLKTFVLALRLAQARLLGERQSRAPLLLLDDIFDRLDPQRVQRLVDVVLAEHYAQVFVTDTHEERLRRLRIDGTPAYYYRVEAGAVRSLTGASDDGAAIEPEGSPQRE